MFRVMSAVVHTGSSEARSACGMKRMVRCSSASTMLGAASTAALAAADLRTVRRDTVIAATMRPMRREHSRLSRQKRNSMPSTGPYAARSNERCSSRPPKRAGRKHRRLHSFGVRVPSLEDGLLLLLLRLGDRLLDLG